MIELPTLPSALLELALNDLEKAETSPDYHVNMGVWYEPIEGDRCHVCLAGAVMAFSLNEQGADRIHSPEHFAEPEITAALVALDRFRKGWIHSALDKLGIPPLRRRPMPTTLDMPLYEVNRSGFWQAMNGLITQLEEAGL